MSRYFIEVAYKGTRYSGFQVQQNANTIQAEVEKAFAILHRQSVSFTGSSRTDAGVHAYQNYFHFDYAGEINASFNYKMNAILPGDIVVKGIYLMPSNAHSRFDATEREYIYHIHTFKNPFLEETSFFYPYKLNTDLLHLSAALILGQTNFYAFSKTNTQANNFNCIIGKSNWKIFENQLIYTIAGNRFLRGMVRLLTASMLQVSREKISIDQFARFFETDNEKCGFSIPPQGLFLHSVRYPYSSNRLFSIF